MDRLKFSKMFSEMQIARENNLTDIYFTRVYLSVGVVNFDQFMGAAHRNPWIV